LEKILKVKLSVYHDGKHLESVYVVIADRDRTIKYLEEKWKINHEGRYHINMMYT